MSDWFHVASLFLFYLNSALLCLNPLAPAITRRSFYLVSAQVKTLFSRPLVYGETKVASSEIS